MAKKHCKHGQKADGRCRKKAKKGSKPACKCTSLPGCVAYVRKAYKFQRSTKAGKAARAEAKMSALYNG